MTKKNRKDPLQKPSEMHRRGIPAFSHAEKLCEVIPVKVGSTLKKAIPKPRSKWIREVIVEKLERVKEEAEDFE